MRTAARKPGVRNTLVALLAVVVASLVFQEIRTGHDLFDLLVFRIAFRFIAIGMVAIWVAQTIRQGKGWHLVGGIGGGILLTIAWTGPRVLLAWLASARGQHAFGYDDISCYTWPILAAVHVLGVFVGIGCVFLSIRKTRSRNSGHM